MCDNMMPIAAPYQKPPMTYDQILRWKLGLARAIEDGPWDMTDEQLELALEVEERDGPWGAQWEDIR